MRTSLPTFPDPCSPVRLVRRLGCARLPPDGYLELLSEAQRHPLHVDVPTKFLRKVVKRATQPKKETKKKKRKGKW